MELVLALQAVTAVWLLGLVQALASDGIRFPDIVISLVMQSAIPFVIR